MVKLKSIGKSVGILAVMFCMDAAAVNNPVTYVPDVNDCGVMKYNGEYYIQGNWMDGDMLFSPDLENWYNRTHVIHDVGSAWAPAGIGGDPHWVHASQPYYENGTFHLYFGMDLYVGHATSANPLGMYTEPVEAPLDSSAIDPAIFQDDDGSYYFYTARLGGGIPGEEIYGQAMSNPNTLTSSPQFLMSASLSWERYLAGSTIMEAPWVIKHRGKYHMFYNANGTGIPQYQIGCAQADTPLGFSNSSKQSAPVLAITTSGVGSGQIDTLGQPWVVRGKNGFEWWIGYFAIDTAGGNGTRHQRIDRIHFFDKKVAVDGPTNPYTPGYHPGPANPQLLNLFAVADGPLSAVDWTGQTAGTWAVVNEEAIQSDQAWALNTVNRAAAANYLFEANLKFTQTQDSEDKAGVIAYYQDTNNWVIVGLDRSLGYGADNWYVHVKEAGVDTVYAGGYGGSVDYGAYHKIRVTKNGSKFDVRIDDKIPPGFSTVDTVFTGAGVPGIYTDQAAAAFDGAIYTIGWDEYDSGVQNWGDSVNGLPMAGSRSYAANGITVNSGYVYKGDPMPEYEFSAQAYAVSGSGAMGLAAVAVDNNNYLHVVIDLTTDKLMVSGMHGGLGFSEPEVSVANKTDYNLRVVKLTDRVIFFVDGEEKLTVNKAYAASPVGLIATGMSARFNGILAFQTEQDVQLAPWVLSDIGAVAFPGTAKYVDETLYMTASGSDIWNLADECSFAHIDMAGDWEFSTRVVNVEESSYWAKAVVMFRDSLATNSGMVYVQATPGGYASLIWRDAPGVGTGVIDTSGHSFPIWLKLKRQGSTFTGFHSADGQSWTEIGTVTPPLSSAGKLGFGVCAQNNTRATSAVFDNSLLTVPLDPGEIGNSQVIYEDEDPAPFTSLAPAVGNGPVSYQWQWDMAGDAQPWQDLADETNATYTAPNMYGWFPTNATLYARRKATDAYYTEYSNEVSLQIKKVFDTSGPYIFIDNFNTIDTTDVNWEYASRQAGGGGTSPYTYYAAHYSIASGKLKNAGFAGWLSLDENMAHYIVGEDFEFSFKLTVLDTSINWTSIYLADVPGDRGNSRLGLLAFGGGHGYAFSLYRGAGTAAAPPDNISVAELTTLLGSPYNKAEEHAIQFISTAGAGGTNTYDFVVDGVVVRSGLEYAFVNDSLSQIEIVGVMAEASAGALYDDIALRYLSTYTRWTEANGLVGTNALRTTDIEPDGLDNLAEYALGGNPTSNDAAAFLPTFEITEAGGSNFMGYVYNRRLNAASLGLTYGLNISTNLQSAWIYSSNAYETGSASIDLYFESVSNAIPATGEAGFVQLKVTAE